MAMVVIPRAGVKFIQAGSERIPVSPVQWACGKQAVMSAAPQAFCNETSTGF
jgi:hypothetical protein